MAKETNLTVEQREEALKVKEAELAEKEAQLNAKENEIQEAEEAEKKANEKAEKEIKKSEKAFKQQLLEEEHVDIFIPPTQLYPEGSNLPVCLNGVTYTIPVGIQFEKGVPKSIYKAWLNSYEADRKARQKMKKKLTGTIEIG